MNILNSLKYMAMPVIYGICATTAFAQTELPTISFDCEFTQNTTPTTGSWSLTSEGTVTYVEVSQDSTTTNYAANTAVFTPYGTCNSSIFNSGNFTIVIRSTIGVNPDGITFSFGQQTGNKILIARDGSNMRARIAYGGSNAANTLLTGPAMASTTEYATYVITRTGSEIKLYVNGISYGSTSTVGAASYGNFQIGGIHGGIVNGTAKYGGYLDRLTVYNGEFTPEQALQIARDNGDYQETTHTVSISSDTNWADLQWTPVAGGDVVTSANLPANAVLALTNTSSSAITFDAASTAAFGSLNVTGNTTFKVVNATGTADEKTVTAIATGRISGDGITCENPVIEGFGSYAKLSDTGFTITTLPADASGVAPFIAFDFQDNKTNKGLSDVTLSATGTDAYVTGISTNPNAKAYDLTSSKLSSTGSFTMNSTDGYTISIITTLGTINWTDALVFGNSSFAAGASAKLERRGVTGGFGCYNIISNEGNFSYDLPDSSDTTFHHYVLVISSTSVSLYLDGTQLGSTQTVDTKLATVTKFKLGEEFNGARSSNAKCDDMRIYNQALSAEQIKSLYNGLTTDSSFTSTTTALTAGENAWSTTTWDPAIENWGDATNVIATVTNDNTTDTTLTVDSAIAITELNINSATQLTIATATDSSLTVAGKINDSASTGSTTLDFAPGAANIIAGSNTTLTQTGTGSLTIGNGKTATLDDGVTMGSYIVSDSSKIRFNGTRGTVTQGNFTGTAGSVSYANATVSFDQTAQPILVETGDNVIMASTSDRAVFKSTITGGNLTIKPTESRRFWLGDGGTILNVQGGRAKIENVTNSGTGNNRGLLIGYSGENTVVAVSNGALEIPVTLNFWNSASLNISGGTATVKGLYNGGGSGNDAVNITSGKLLLGSDGVWGPAIANFSIGNGTFASYENANVANAVTITETPIIASSSATSITMAGVISGAGAPSFGSAEYNGTVVLATANTYTGNSTIAAGTVKLQNAAGLSTGSVTLNAGSTLDLTALTLDETLSVANTFTTTATVENKANVIVKLTNEQIQNGTTVSVMNLNTIENVNFTIKTVNDEVLSSKGYALALTGGVVTVNTKTVTAGTDKPSVEAENFIFNSLPDDSTAATVTITATTKTNQALDATASVETAYALGITPSYTEAAGTVTGTVKYEFGITKLTPTSQTAVNFEAKIIVETGTIDNDAIGTVKLLASTDGATWTAIAETATTKIVAENTCTVTFDNVTIGDNKQFKVACTK